MLKLDKSTVLKYYALFTILVLALYKLITGDLPKFSNTFIQLTIIFNLVFASYYLIYKDNVVLNGSNNLKSFFVAFTSEYILALEIVSSLGKSQELTIYYTNYVYFGFILVHMGLSQRFPEFFNKFIRFNFGFTYACITLGLFINYSLINILIYSGVSIIGNYYYDINLDFMAIICTYYIYSTTLFEAIYILIRLIFPKGDYYILPIVISLIAFIFIAIFVFVSKVEAHLKDLKNRDDNVYLESERLPLSA